MPKIVYASELSVSEMFENNSRARGLDLERIPQAVQLAVNALTQGVVSPFNALLADLPASARAYDWMDAAFSAFAEMASRTIVIDDEDGGEGGTEVGGNTAGDDGGDTKTAEGGDGGDE